MFNSYEKIERVLYQTGNVQLKNVVIFGNKTSEGKKAEPVNTRNYPSTKYTNKNELKSTTIKSSDFLTFFYNDYENSLKEEIFLSYTHLDDLESFLSEIIELLSTEGVFDDNTRNVSSQYSQVMISSEPFGGGKQIHAFPDTFQNADGDTEYGVTLIFNREEFATTMSLKGFNGLIRIINSFNLLTNSNQLIQIGMLDSIERTTRNGGGMISNNNMTRNESFGNTTSNRSPLAKRGIGSRSPLANKFNSNKLNNPLKNNRTVEANNTNQSEDIYSDEPVNEIETSKKPMNNVKPNSNKSNPIGINNILDTAKEISLENSQDIDF